MKLRSLLLCYFFFTLPLLLHAKVKLGADCFFEKKIYLEYQGKRVGIITNHTGYTSDLITTIDQLIAPEYQIQLKAIFFPEHGLDGSVNAAKEIAGGFLTKWNIPAYSLHGATRRPQKEQLEKLDALFYDIQDIGLRSYTYISTLFLAMEEAAKAGVEVVVMDRPNPLGGELVDGYRLDASLRSFIGYIDVPYCHGMTVGELARYFNEHYKIGCKLRVIPMEGWKRSMNFKETGLVWIPTSPNIPESTTPLFCATTGILGELGIVNIGVKTPQPFKIVVAPWIQSHQFSQSLNQLELPGVHFLPTSMNSEVGLYKGDLCHGVQIIILNDKIYKPFETFCAMLGILNSLYPKKVTELLKALPQNRKNLFCSVSGTNDILTWLTNEKFITWKLMDRCRKERASFVQEREKFLIYTH